MATEAGVTSTSREILDNEGDVLIQTRLNELLVSSKILILSSSVFKTMLQSQFREGSPRSASHPLHLALPDDSHEGLTITLKVLHFQRAKITEDPAAVQLLDIAILCDKYDLVTSMQSAMLQWTQLILDKEQDVLTLQKLSLATMTMGLDKDFARATRLWILKSTGEEEEEAFGEAYSFDILHDRVRKERENKTLSSLATIEGVLLSLSNSGSLFPMSVKRCVGCNASKPLETKKCKNCKGENFDAIICSAGLRVCEMIQKLNTANLFPSFRQAGQSQFGLLKAIKALPLHLHNCDGKSNCPLIVEVGRLEERLESSMARFSGICLEDMRPVEL